MSADIADTVDPTADLVAVHPVDEERQFLRDRELVAFNAILQETTSLVRSGCVPRPLRHEIAEACVILATALHCGPYLNAWKASR